MIPIALPPVCVHADPETNIATGPSTGATNCALSGNGPEELRMVIAGMI